MELEAVIQKEVRKNKYHIISLICGIQKIIIIQMNLFAKQK